MCYLSIREGFTNAKVRKRMQIKELFNDEKCLIVSKNIKMLSKSGFSMKKSISL